MKDKKVPRSGVNGFMNWKSCLSNLIALYSEMTGKLDEDTKLRGVADRPDECPYWGMMGCNTAWQKMNCRSR